MSGNYTVGEVKWFGDKQTGGQYGIITGLNASEYFFHISEVRNFTPTTGILVAFKAQPSSRRRGRMDATNVSALIRLDNQRLILDLALKHSNVIPRDKYFETLAKRFGDLAPKSSDELHRIIEILKAAELIPNTSDSGITIENYSSVFAFLDCGLSAELRDAVIDTLIGKTSYENIVAGYAADHLPLTRKVLDILYLHWFDLDEQTKAKLLTDARNDAYEFLEGFTNKVLVEINTNEEAFVDYLLNMLKQLDWKSTPDDERDLPYCLRQILLRCPITLRIKLYLNHILTFDKSMVVHLVRMWDSLTTDDINKVLRDSELGKVSIADALLQQRLLPLVTVQPYKAFELLNQMFIMFTDKKAQFSSAVVDCDELKVVTALLWLNGIVELADPRICAPSVSGLTNSDQRLFLKRLVAYKSNGTYEFTISDALSWAWTDISTWLALEVMDRFSRGNHVDETAIYGIILGHIESGVEDVTLDGYLDECPGRTIRRNGKLARVEPPSFVKWCEGRELPPEEGADAPVREWWCGNGKCLQPAIVDRSYMDYQGFTLWNMLRAFGINIHIDHYQVLLGTLNRVRRFLSHLFCRDCKHIMHPIDQSNYALFRVTRFACRTVGCTSHGKEVYVSRCLNGKCLNIIDSRDSVKCVPAGHDQIKCGWYICTYCMACCSTKKIDTRKFIMKRTGQAYSCHDEGHHDRGELCCPQCGHVLTINRGEDVAEWINTHGGDSAFVRRSGTRKDGGKWYILQRHAFESDEEFYGLLSRAIHSGYSVPDYGDYDRQEYLLGTPFSGTPAAGVSCPNCDFSLSIGELQEHHDYQRITALRFHGLFKNTSQRQMTT